MWREVSQHEVVVVGVLIEDVREPADGRHEEEPADPSRFAGTWQGVFSAGEIETRLVFHLTLNEDKSWLLRLHKLVFLQEMLMMLSENSMRHKDMVQTTKRQVYLID